MTAAPEVDVGLERDYEFAWKRDERVAAVVARIVGGRPGLTSACGWEPATILAAVTDLADAPIVGVTGSRHRGLRQQVACYAAVYGRYFLPPSAEWELTGRDGQLLTWEHRDGALVVDALRCAHKDDVLIPSRLRGWLNNLWKVTPGVVGVRVLALAGPLSSLLWTPSGEACPLPTLPDLVGAPVAGGRT